MKISYTSVIKFAKILLSLISLSLMAMIFMISSADDFGDPVKVETKGLDFSTGFQVDGAKLSSLDLKGNRFNFRAKKINPINDHLPIISGDHILGTITFASEMLIKIQAEKASFNTKNNLIGLEGALQLENKDFKLLGSSVSIDLEKNIIHSDKKTIIKLLNTEIEAGKLQVLKPDPSNSYLKFMLEAGVRFEYFL